MASLITTMAKSVMVASSNSPHQPLELFMPMAAVDWPLAVVLMEVESI
jgi:hypothetical protein